MIVKLKIILANVSDHVTIALSYKYHKNMYYIQFYDSLYTVLQVP